MFDKYHGLRNLLFLSIFLSSSGSSMFIILLTESTNISYLKFLSLATIHYASPENSLGFLPKITVIRKSRIQLSKPFFLINLRKLSRFNKYTRN